jgi:RNA polymerase sigma-70 factor (ECF subfamily)
LRRARSLLGSEQEAWEALQELFLSLLDRPEQLSDPASSLTGFLYKATTNLCLNRIRNRATRARLLDAHVAPRDAEGRSEGPRAERLVILRELLAGLPDDLASAAVYFYGDEMTHEEIAKVMGCSRRHVGDLIERLHARVAMSEGAV